MNNNKQNDEKKESKSAVKAQTEAAMVQEPDTHNAAEVWVASALADPLRGIAQFLREHPAMLLTLIYIYTSMAGLIYMWFLFQRFGINVMDFAKAADFLLAAFKQPKAFVYWVGGHALVLYWIWDAYRQRQGKKSSAPVSARRIVSVALRWLVVLLMYTTVPLLFAVGDSGDIRSGRTQKFMVEVQISGDAVGSCTLEGEVFLIGTTEEFAFFYDRDQNCTHIIPVANIVHMYTVPLDSTGSSATPTGAVTETPR